MAPDAGARARGIEVGHIFYFGTKYSKAMNCTVTAPDGSEGASGDGQLRHRRVTPGRRGDRGQPRQVRHHLAGQRCAIQGGDHQPEGAAMRRAMRCVNRFMRNSAATALYDDRDERAGRKFADADLMGHPWQIIVGPRGAAGESRTEAACDWRADRDDARRGTGADRTLIVVSVAQLPLPLREGVGGEGGRPLRQPPPQGEGESKARDLNVRSVRAHGRRPLPARAQGRAVRLDHCGVFPGRHRARRRHADRGDQRHERLPDRTCSHASSASTATSRLQAYAGQKIDNYQDLVTRIRAIPLVVSVSPYIRRPGPAHHRTAAARAEGLVRGMTLDDLRALRSVSDHIVAGKLDDFSGNNAIVVGVGPGAVPTGCASAIH